MFTFVLPDASGVASQSPTSAAAAARSFNSNSTSPTAAVAIDATRDTHLVARSSAVTAKGIRIRGCGAKPADGGSEAEVDAMAHQLHASVLDYFSGHDKTGRPVYVQHTGKIIPAEFAKRMASVARPGERPAHPLAHEQLP